MTTKSINSSYTSGKCPKCSAEVNLTTTPSVVESMVINCPACGVKYSVRIDREVLFNSYDMHTRGT